MISDFWLEVISCVNSNKNPSNRNRKFFWYSFCSCNNLDTSLLVPGFDTTVRKYSLPQYPPSQEQNRSYHLLFLYNIPPAVQTLTHNPTHLTPHIGKQKGVEEKPSMDRSCLNISWFCFACLRIVCASSCQMMFGYNQTNKLKLVHRDTTKIVRNKLQLRELNSFRKQTFTQLKLEGKKDRQNNSPIL